MSTDDGYSYDIPRWNDVEWGSATFPLSPASPPRVTAPPEPATPATARTAPRWSPSAVERKPSPAPVPDQHPPGRQYHQAQRELQHYGPPAGQPLGRPVVRRRQPATFDYPAPTPPEGFDPSGDGGYGTPYTEHRGGSVGRLIGGIALLVVGFSFLQAGIQVAGDYPDEPAVVALALMIPVGILIGGLSLLGKGRRRA